MTRERAKELAPIIAAWGEGKAIEVKTYCGPWMELTGSIEAEWSEAQSYRIKPEPRTRPMTRGETLYMVTTTPAMIARKITQHENIAYPCFPAGYLVVDTNDLELFEYAIIDKTGEPISGWKKFEVEE